MNSFFKMAILGTVVGFSCGFVFGYIPVQVQFLKNALQNSTQTINCASCDFRGAQDLAGLDMHGLHAPGISFQPCVVSKENQDNELMICIPNQVAQLTGVNLANANFFSSCFDQAILDKADLSGADFTNSSVQNASLKDAKVTRIITTNATFCNSVMPDGKICKDSWTGQGVTIDCNCTDKNSSSVQSQSASQPVKQPVTKQVEK